MSIVLNKSILQKWCTKNKQGSSNCYEDYYVYICKRNYRHLPSDGRLSTI